MGRGGRRWFPVSAKKREGCWLESEGSSGDLGGGIRENWGVEGKGGRDYGSWIDRWKKRDDLVFEIDFAG